MTNTQTSRPAATFFGLIIALFGIQAIVMGFRFFTGQNHSDLQIVVREFSILAMVGLLLLLVTRIEKLPLTSIGFRGEKVGKSILWGLALAVLTLLVTVGLYMLLQTLGIHLGSSDAGAYKPSLWVTSLIMLRAGIAEEICFRGYAIERLQQLSGNRWLAALLPLVVFAALHYKQGIGGVIAALVLGGVFTLFYLKRRDLLANIVGHFSADFVLNVLLPLLGSD